MKCYQCSNELPDKAKFCLECGAKQQLTCACGEVLPPSAKFCLECGTAVGGNQATPKVVAPSPVLPVTAKPSTPASAFKINNGVLEEFLEESLTEVVIPDSVTMIGEKAFYECSSLTSVVIPDSVTQIGERAFFGCNSLTSVVIPDSVTQIGERAFGELHGHSALTTAKVAAGSYVETYMKENYPNVKLVYS